jgi:glycerophosphoryl diester phosphodiesterase
MKRLLLLATILLATACSQDIPESRVIAHRGFWQTEGSAQNSLTSLRLACENGFYGSECDVQLTADSCFIVFHDTNLHGVNIEDMTFEQVLADTTLTNGERISTVDEYFSTFAGLDTRTKLIIELKQQPSEEMMSLSIAKTAEAIEKYDIRHRVEIISFSYRACKELAAIFPDIPVSFLDRAHNVSFSQMLDDFIDGIDYRYNCILENLSLIDEAHEAGFIVDVWTPNDPEEVLTMVNAGLDFVTTDRPDVMAAILGEK